MKEVDPKYSHLHNIGRLLDEIFPSKNLKYRTMESISLLSVTLGLSLGGYAAVNSRVDVMAVAALMAGVAAVTRLRASRMLRKQ